MSPINEFDKVARYNTNVQKSMSFLYINNELSERETKKKISFTITTTTTTTNKVLRINLTKKAKDLC